MPGFGRLFGNEDDRSVGKETAQERKRKREARDAKRQTDRLKETKINRKKPAPPPPKINPDKLGTGIAAGAAKVIKETTKTKNDRLKEILAQTKG